MNKITKSGLMLAVFAMLLGGVTLLTTHTKAAHAASPTPQASVSEPVSSETPETASSDPGNVAGGGHQDATGSNVDHQFNGVE